MGEAVPRIPPLAEASALHSPGAAGATAVGCIQDSCRRVDGLLEVANRVDGAENVSYRGVASVLEVEGCCEVDGIVVENVLESLNMGEVLVVDGIEGVGEIGRRSHIDIMALVMNILGVHASVMVVSYWASHMHHVVRNLGDLPVDGSIEVEDVHRGDG